MPSSAYSHARHHLRHLYGDTSTEAPYRCTPVPRRQVKNYNSAIIMEKGKRRLKGKEKLKDRKGMGREGEGRGGKRMEREGRKEKRREEKRREERRRVEKGK